MPLARRITVAMIHINRLMTSIEFVGILLNETE